MTNSIFERFKTRYEEKLPTEYTIPEYLDLCKNNKLTYGTATERMIDSIGEPVIIDTSTDDRLSRIFSNKKIKRYPAFADFYGMEDVIESIVAFYRQAAQGLEERKQILYLLGPVGGGKSSLAERLKELMQKNPIYTISAFNKKTNRYETSPIWESPMGLFDQKLDGDYFEKHYGIKRRYLKPIMSPWTVERLKENDGDLNMFKIIKIYPSILQQVGITKVEPGDENNQDISSLVGKVDISALDDNKQNSPDSYLWSGGLNVTTQGLMEFVEMFKAPIKMLHPLLEATQSGHYNGNEQFGAIPYQGSILAHCFSEDTELLTDVGWLTHDKIVGDIKLATMNIESELMEFQKPIKKFEENYNGKMYHFESNSMDHLVTPNHKMLYHTQYTKKWVSCTAEQFGETGKIIPVSAKNILSDFDISDDLLRYIVWVVSAGSLNGHSIRWHLGKQRKVDRFTSLLNRLGFEYNLNKTNYTTTGGLETTSIVVQNILNIGKSLPDCFYQLSARQANIIIQEYSHTDGTRVIDGKTSFEDDVDAHIQLSSNNKNDIDLLQYLAISAGHKANLCSHTKGKYSEQYFLSIRQNCSETRADYARKETKYSGKVFCFETENHTLIARRNGKVIITKNSNESEWNTFKNNKNNEAFLDRIYIVKVPYCLRTTEETKIYRKLIEESDLSEAPVAPGTFEALSQYSVMTRLKEVENSDIFSKMETYDGKNLKEKDPKTKSLEEYRNDAGVSEGMTGTSTRFAFKILSKVFNQDPEEVAACPIYLFRVLKRQIEQEQLPQEEEKKRLEFIDKIIIPKYAEFLGDEINKAFIESYGDYGQNVFDRYIMFADAWCDHKEIRDPATDELYDREALNANLEKIEKSAGISNPKDFRNEVVGFCLRYAKSHQGKNPPWTSYEKLRTVIEKNIFANTEELLPVISFTKKATTEDERKHSEFVERMMKLGYTKKMVQAAVEWHTRYKKNN